MILEEIEMIKVIAIHNFFMNLFCYYILFNSLMYKDDLQRTRNQ